MDRKNRSRPRLLAVALAVALALPVAALAWPGHDHGERMQKKLDALDLDADTRAQVDAVLEGTRDQRRERKQAMRDARDAMRELMRNATATEAQLVEQAERVAELELEGLKTKVARHLALRDLLTAEQLETLTPSKHRGGKGDGECEGKHGKRRHRFGSQPAGSALELP